MLSNYLPFLNTTINNSWRSHIINLFSNLILTYLSIWFRAKFSSNFY